MAAGSVTTLVAEESEADVQLLRSYAAQLHLHLQEDPEPAPEKLPADADLESSKHALEDLFNLM